MGLNFDDYPGFQLKIRLHCMKRIAGEEIFVFVTRKSPIQVNKLSNLTLPLAELDIGFSV
jgi:hypothetical protein